MWEGRRPTVRILSFGFGANSTADSTSNDDPKDDGGTYQHGDPPSLRRNRGMRLDAGIFELPRTSMSVDVAG